uniref:PAS domain S-box protein n=2 Tax=Aliarcobacter sp. TaxID=2321116 RepID=UPI004047F728
MKTSNILDTSIKLKYSEDKFKLLFEHSPIGMAIIDQKSGAFIEVNNWLLNITGYTKEEFLNLSFWDITPKEYELQELEQIQQLKLTGKFGPNEKEYIKKDKSRFFIEISGFSMVDIDGKDIVYGLITDITDKKNNNIIYEDNKQLLEYIAIENSIHKLFDKIINLAETRCPETMCSILLIDDSKEHLINGSSPSLPKFYSDAINGVKIGDKVGSCGSAAFNKKRVIVSDINNHENWKDYLELTQKANLYACWSEPILSSSNEILGTFAMYNSVSRTPTNFELKLIESYANLASKAIEKDFYTKKIKNSKYQIEQLFNKAQSGLVYITPDRKVIKANQRFADLLGYETADELSGVSVEKFHLSKENYEQFGKNIFNIFNKKENYFVEFELKKKDGSPIWCEFAGKILEEDNPSAGILWTINGISLRKKFENDLKSREILLKNIISTIPDMLWLKDKNGVYLMCNKEFEKFLGEKESDIIGKTDYDFLEKDMADIFTANDKIVINNSSVIKNDEWLTYASDKKRVLLETSKKALKNQDNEITGILGIAHDITKRVEKENELKELNKYSYSLAQSQKVLLSLFDKGESVLFKWNNDSTWSVDYASLNVLNFFGYTRDEFLSNEIKYSSCIHKDDLKKVMNEVNYAINNKLDYFKHEPYRIMTRDGDIKWVLDYTVTQKENGEIINFIGYISDITEQMKNQEMLIQQSKLSSMGQMIGNIAHQWRQPLSAISTQATGMKLKKQFSNLSDDEFNYMCDSINHQVQYLSKTIDDFRNFIKGDRKYEEINLKKLIDKLLILLSGSIKNNDINVILDIESDINFIGYENELLQCFINIFNNSKDALIDVNPSEKLLYIKGNINKNSIEISFKDNGGGIDEEILPNIFNPYFTTKHESQGTGLGLYMTYNLIVDGMNGSIEALNCEYEYKNINRKGIEIIITIPY